MAFLINPQNGNIHKTTKTLLYNYVVYSFFVPIVKKFLQHSHLLPQTFFPFSFSKIFLHINNCHFVTQIKKNIAYELWQQQMIIYCQNQNLSYNLNKKNNCGD